MYSQTKPVNSDPRDRLNSIISDESKTTGTPLDPIQNLNTYKEPVQEEKQKNHAEIFQKFGGMPTPTLISNS